MAQPGDSVIPGCSTKGGDESRFKSNFEKYAREGVNIVDPLSCAFVASGEALSASDFRAALDAGNGLERFIPDGTDAGEILSVLGVEPAPVMEALARLVEEMMDEMSSMAAGNVAGYSGSQKKKKSSLIREEEPEEDDEVVEEIFNYLVGKGVML